jgi:hypothetical protein
MLQVVAPYVAEMLHLKLLTINVVADVAGFQTMSTCKPHIKSLNINVVAVFLWFFEQVIIAHPDSLGEDGGWRSGVKGQRSESGKRESGNGTSVRHKNPTNRLESR